MSNLTNLQFYHFGFSVSHGDEGRCGLINGVFVRFDDVKEFLKPTTNNDYAAAQRVVREFLSSYSGTEEVAHLSRFIDVRLNAQKDAHCA